MTANFLMEKLINMKTELEENDIKSIALKVKEILMPLLSSRKVEEDTLFNKENIVTPLS